MKVGMGRLVLPVLEDTLRAKGDMSLFEEQMLGACKELSTAGFALSTAALVLPFWFGAKWFGVKPVPRFYLSVGASLMGGMLAFDLALNKCVKRFLEYDGQRMQMELAKIILSKHSNDTSMVELVKRHFFPEQVFDDLHQDKPLFRWRPRYSYVDSAFLERIEETEDGNSDDNGKSVTRQATSPFGDLMADPLECILGSPEGNTESKPSDNTGTLSKRELRAHRRAHRHHRRHAENAAAV